MDEVQDISSKLTEPNQHYCVPCKIQLKNYKSFWGHLKSKTHIENSGTGKYEYNCEKCDYHTNTPFVWNKHLETKGHQLSPEENRKLRSEIGAKAAATGDKTEEYILDILKTNPEIASAIRIGQTGNRFDIIYQMKDEGYCRALQIKTLCKSYGQEQYSLTFQKEHQDDTLIVAVDTDRKHFCLYLFGDNNKLGMSLTFTDTAILNNGPNVHLYTDIKVFTQKLFQMIKLSTITEWNQLTDHLTENWTKEFKMLERLKPVLEKWKLDYKPMMTVNSSTDCLIDNCRVQCKFSDNKKGKKYYVSFKKETSKTTYEPYSSNDFDFLICETDSTGKFYVIPMEVLIEKGYVRTDQYDGIVVLYLASQEDYESDWTLDYIDRFDLITKKSSGSLGSDSTSILGSIESKSVLKLKPIIRKSIALKAQPSLNDDSKPQLVLSKPIKKPPNCWQLYVKTVNSLTGGHRGLPFAEFNKLLGQHWRFMPSAEKAFWTHLATNPQSVDDATRQQTFEATKASILSKI
jgi:hypothetical protein